MTTKPSLWLLSIGARVRIADWSFNICNQSTGSELENKCSPNYPDESITIVAVMIGRS